MDNQYLILVDENGQPYIAHAFSFRNTFRNVGNAVRNTASNVGRRARDTHKYIQKIAKDGKTRYFYSQEEWEAYLRGDSKKPTTIGGRIKDAVGYDERERRDQAKREYESDMRSGKRMEDRGRTKLMAIDSSSSNPNVHKEAEDALSLQKKGIDMQDKAQEKYGRTADEYDRTILGTVEKITDRFSNEKVRVSCEEAFDSFMKHPTPANQDKYRKAYEQWTKSSGYEHNRELMMTPDEAYKHAKKETEQLLKIAMKEATDVEKMRVGTDSNGYEYLDSYEAGDRAKAVSEQYESLRKLLINVDYAADQEEIRKQIDEHRQKIKEFQLANEKELKDLATNPKQFFDDYKLDETLKKTKNRDYKKIVSELNKKNTDYNPVEIFNNIPSEETIISNVGGGDRTLGSCSSLALAYIGNKAGYKVLDFRGGPSQNIFSQYAVMNVIADLEGVDSKVVKTTMDSKKTQLESAVELLHTAEEGKEYYFATGQHGTIVRKKNGNYQYLELQSENNNGWETLDDGALVWRFSCSLGKPKSKGVEAQTVMIDAESLGKSDEFVSLLGYINTNIYSQKKGKGGHEK